MYVYGIKRVSKKQLGLRQCARPSRKDRRTARVYRGETPQRDGRTMDLIESRSESHSIWIERGKFKGKASCTH